MTRRGRRLGRRASIALALLLGVAVGVTPAYAYWALAGAATATVQAASLTAPAAPTVGTATSSSLTISGTLPSPQVAGATYAVKRGATTICAPTGTPFSCTDTGLSPVTTYTYSLVASVAAWTATSPTATGATLCATPETYTLTAPSTATAGTAITALLAVKCNGTPDTTYTGNKTLTWSAVAASPSGQAASLPSTATFAGGTASVPITLYAAGSATLTPTSGAITWPSSTITVSAAPPANFQLTAISSKNVAVILTCNAFTDPATARSCTASDPAVHGSHSWTATPNLLDTWANPATTSTALTVTQSVFDGTTTTTTTFTITAGSGAGPQLTAAITNHGQVSISLTATGIQNFTVTNAR